MMYGPAFLLNVKFFGVSVMSVAFTLLEYVIVLVLSFYSFYMSGSNDLKRIISVLGLSVCIDSNNDSRTNLKQ